MKWAGLFFFGFLILLGGLGAALWQLDNQQSIGTTWTAIGAVILLGLGIMIAVSHSGTKENIESDRR